MFKKMFKKALKEKRLTMVYCLTEILILFLDKPQSYIITCFIFQVSGQTLVLGFSGLLVFFSFKTILRPTGIFKF